MGPLVALTSGRSIANKHFNSSPSGLTLCCSGVRWNWTQTDTPSLGLGFSKGRVRGSVREGFWEIGVVANRASMPEWEFRGAVALGEGPAAPEPPAPFSPGPSLPAATPPNAVDRPCLRLKVYVRPTSECSGRAGLRPHPRVLARDPLSGQRRRGGHSTASVVARAGPTPEPRFPSASRDILS